MPWRALGTRLPTAAGDTLLGSARVIGLLEAATGVGVLFILIGYLPSVYQSFSRREIAVSQLAPRAGAPPSAGALLHRLSERGGKDDLVRYLREWEFWAAELMETHLSYPILAYYRSQHIRLNWLAALTTVVDTSAFVIAATPDGEAGRLSSRTRSDSTRSPTSRTSSGRARRGTFPSA